MSRFVIALAGMCLLPFMAHAIFFNDSNVVEIEDGTPPNVVKTSGVTTGSAGYPFGGGNSDEVNTGYDFSQTDEEGGSESGSGAGSASAGGNGIASLPQTTIQALQSLLEALLKNGVFAGTSFGALGFLSSIDLSVSNGPSLTIGELLKEGVMVIDGDMVREALRGNIDLRSVLTTYERAIHSSDAREYGFVAAKTALLDRNVARIAFTASAFEIRYRSRGYLFGFIPMSFPVQVKVVPLAEQTESRISISLPWYRFFVREFFTVPGLRDDIDAVLKSEMEKVATGTDPNLALFEAVANYLRSKIGTVSVSQ